MLLAWSNFILEKSNSLSGLHVDEIRDVERI